MGAEGVNDLTFNKVICFVEYLSWYLGYISYTLSNENNLVTERTVVFTAGGCNR